MMQGLCKDFFVVADIEEKCILQGLFLGCKESLPSEYGDYDFILKHIVGSQIKGSRYKGLYVLLPLMDFNEKLMDFN